LDTDDADAVQRLDGSMTLARILRDETQSLKDDYYQAVFGEKHNEAA
jgi:hypothetical protein